MAKGISIRFKSYEETIPTLLRITKFENELKKHAVIVLKPSLKSLNDKTNTPSAFTEAVLKYCLEHKVPEAQVFIAEGSDGVDTREVFEAEGYNKLSETYSVGLIDLNTAETSSVRDGEFLKFQEIQYPKLLENSLIVSLPKLSPDDETEIAGSLANMLGAFPAKHYKGFFASNKSKIRKEPIKYAIHDILRCKMPQTAIIDASEQGSILIGAPIEIDKQAARLLGKEWKSVQHLRLIDETISRDMALKAQKDAFKTQKLASAEASLGK